jgi:antitoxin HicB
MALAKRLGCDHKDVRRLLDPRYPSKISSIEKALQALGRRLDVHVRNAA